MWNYSENDNKQDEFDDLKDLEIVEIKDVNIPVKTASGGVVYEETSFWNGRASHWKECYVTLAVFGLNVLVFFMQVLNRGVDQYGYATDKLIDAGSASWPTVIEKGQVYRLITCQYLHAGVAHLLGNMVFLLLCGIMLEKRLSRKRWAILYGVGGLGASLTSVLLGHYYPALFDVYVNFGSYAYKVGEVKKYDVASVGASGAIAALIAAIVLYKLLLSSPLDGYNDGKWAPIIELAVAYLLYSALSGMFEETSGVDNKAHIGGLITGIVVMLVYMIIEYRKQSQPTWE
ncbi:MAG: rhomboid family intramembrane serine protease [Lachnospiraceae bacterium]|nr:rhomboid family intramembrane serine protease [Lachnospiraceae bacterium]